MSTVDAPDTGRRERVNGLITACWTTQVIAEAVRLGLPEKLSAGPADSDLAVAGPIKGLRPVALDWLAPAAAPAPLGSMLHEEN